MRCCDIQSPHSVLVIVGTEKGDGKGKQVAALSNNQRTDDTLTQVLFTTNDTRYIIDPGAITRFPAYSHKNSAIYARVIYQEALVEAYKNMSRWDIKRQVLSVMSGVASFAAIKKFIPELSTADRPAARCKSHIRVHINEGHEVTTVEETKRALLSNGGLGGVRVTVVIPCSVFSDQEQSKIISVNKFNNFQYVNGSIIVWRAYQWSRKRKDGDDQKFSKRYVILPK